MYKIKISSYTDIGDVKTTNQDCILSKGDIFLICSDGLTDMLSDDEIFDYMRTKERLSKRCKQLVKKAEEKGGKDNITVIIAEII